MGLRSCASKLLAALPFSKHVEPMKQLSFLVAAALFSASLSHAQNSSRADQQLAAYFRAETLKLSARCLPENLSLADWRLHRAEYRRQLQEMLGLWPMPERTDLKPVVTGRLDGGDFTVEKLYFQASPGLYVTASLFLPKNLSQPAPTILYECGHWRFSTNGISYGNKAVYQADGEWYARNGYVCLMTDTLLAGEIPGIHTGTRDHGLWWWNARGYTPAGIEAWFGIRALDYLSTRPEVDTNRFGITGHSGGGAYSWTVTALDDRIKVAAPLAGMADVQSHVLDGVIDSHCDCNFFVNYYRWDFPQLAALAAPRPLLLGGTDNDRLFNLPNSERIQQKLRHVYQLYNAANQFGFVIAPGPHDEVPELQLAVMRWFNRYLKGVELPITTVPQRFFAPIDLKVFETLPADAINTNIADTFVPMGKPAQRSAEELRALLNENVFAGWPDEKIAFNETNIFSAEHDGVRLSAWDFDSQENVRLRLYLLENIGGAKSNHLTLTVLDPLTWTNWLSNLTGAFGTELNEELRGAKVAANPDGYAKLKSGLSQNAMAFFAPRGVGLDAWSGDEKAQTKIRRRFMLLGQTRDSMRVWDIRRAIQMLSQVRSKAAPIELNAAGMMAVNGLYAALFESNVKKLGLSALPNSHLFGPDYLGVLKICDIPEVLAAEKAQAEIVATTRVP